MAGTLVANTINTDTGLFSTNNAYSGIAKAWVNYNPTTQTINNSFNVSSVTRNSTGNFTVNFSTAMPNANYAVSGMGGVSTGGSGNSTNEFLTTYSLTTTAFQFGTLNTSAVNVDNTLVTAIVFSS